MKNSKYDHDNDVNLRGELTSDERMETVPGV